MSSEERRRDWRNINVRRNRCYEALVDKLCTRKSTYSNRPIFEFNKDLMVFAAVLGYSQEKKEPLQPDSIQITLGTYASDEKDGFIYLMALLNTQKAECLKDDNITESVKLFEEYCNGGLSIITSWMEDNPADLEGVDTLVDKIFDELVATSSDATGDTHRAEVEF